MYKVSEAAFDPNGLLVQLQGAPVYGAMVTIVSGQNLAAGSLLGQITTGGKYALSLAASSDGSEAPVAIIPEACDASGGDKSAFVYFLAEVNEAKVVFGTGHTAASQRRRLAQLGLLLWTPKAA